MAEFFICEKEVLLYLFDKLSEDSWVFYGHLREYLAVKSNTFLLLEIDESRVLEAMKAKGVVEADNPEGTEATLLGTTVTMSVLASLDYGFFGFTEEILTSPAETFGHFEEILVAFFGLNAALDSSHTILRVGGLIKWRGRD